MTTVHRLSNDPASDPVTPLRTPHAAPVAVIRAGLSRAADHVYELLGRDDLSDCQRVALAGLLNTITDAARDAS